MMGSEADLTRAEAEASEWFTRLKRTKVSTEDLYSFQAWRKDATNAAAFKRVEAAWKLSARLAGDPQIQAATSKALRENPAPTARVKWTRLAPTITGLAVLLLALAGAVLVVGFDPVFSTEVGEQRLVTLEDGSRLRLNTNSRVRVSLTRSERRVVLERGEAYFDVAHDAARPFVVRAGNAQVRALGTRFDVRRERQGVVVLLVQGRVRVGNGAGDTVELMPNQQLTVTQDGLSTVRAADAVAAAGWTTGRLTFRDMALRDAVAEMNRYSERKIVLETPAAVANEPVSGEFNVGDTRAFVTAVSLSFGLEAQWRPDGGIHLVAPGL